MSRSKQLGGFPTSARLVSDRRTRTPPQSPSRSRNFRQRARLHRRYQPRHWQRLAFHFLLLKVPRHSSPPTTNSQFYEQSAAGERRFSTQLSFICALSKQPLLTLAILDTSVARTFCRVTHIALLSEVAKQLTLSARVTVGVRRACKARRASEFAIGTPIAESKRQEPSPVR